MGDGSTQQGNDGFATDDLTTLNRAPAPVGFSKVERVKIGYGLDGDLTDVSQTDPLPISIAQSAGNAPMTTGNLTAAQAQSTSIVSTTGQVMVDISRMGNVTFYLLATTTFNGTVVFEATMDPSGSSATWEQLTCTPENTQSGEIASNQRVINGTLMRNYTTGLFGFRWFKIRCSVWTSGTLAVALQPGPSTVENNPTLGQGSAIIGVLGGGITGATGTVTTSGTIGTAVSLFVADPIRKEYTLTNDGVGIVTVAFGVTASTTSVGLKIRPGRTASISGALAQLPASVISSVASNPVRYNTVA